MARTPRRFNRIQALLDSYEAAIRDAFMAAIQDVRDGADLAAIVSRLERGDIDGAMRAVNLDPASFRRVETAVTAAFVAGGEATVGNLPRLRGPDGARLIVRFDGRLPRAERWTREHSAQLVTRIIDEERDALRGALTRGLEEGRNPRNVAPDLMGRVNRATGRREGGIIGLDGPRAERYEAVARGMRSADGVRGLVIEGRDGQLRMRYKVNRATENRIIRAYRAGTGLSHSDQVLSQRQYGNALALDRGETIARTEAMEAIAAGRKEGMDQTIDSGAIRREAVKKRWLVGPATEHARVEHQAMRGVEVAYDEPFTLPDGTRMMYPHDPSLGAGPEHIIRCRCDYAMIVDFLDGIE